MPVFVGVGINSNAYSIETLNRPLEGMRRALLSLLFAAGAVMFVAFFLQAGALISRMAFAIGSVLTAMLIVCGRAAFHRVARRMIGPSPVDEIMIVDGVDYFRASGSPSAPPRRSACRPDLRDPMMLDQLARRWRGSIGS